MKTEFIIIGILFIVPSVLYFFFPDFFLTFGSRWKYKDATPSDAARMVGTIVAVLGIIAGILLVLYGFFYVQINGFFSGTYALDPAETGIQVSKITY